MIALYLDNWALVMSWGWRKYSKKRDKSLPIIMTEIQRTIEQDILVLLQKN